MRKSTLAVLALLALVEPGLAEMLPILKYPRDGEPKLPLKWGTPQVGIPAEITWHWVESPTLFESNYGTKQCREMLPPTLAGVSKMQLEAATEQAAADWSEIFGIRMRKAESATEADVLLGIQASPRGTAWTELIVDSELRGDAYVIQRAAICLNATIDWRIGDEWHAVGSIGDAWSVSYVLTHEIGHVIGLEHVQKGGGFMSFKMPEPAGFTPLFKRTGTYLYGPALK